MLESKSVILHRIKVPDSRGFHAAVLKFSDKYICVYHNSEQHRLASCFLDLDFNVIEGSHTENLGISINMDPRIFKYQDQFYISTSQGHHSPVYIQLYQLKVTEKIEIVHASLISFFPPYKNFPIGRINEKNWTPWEYHGKFFYTYSMNPHRILEFDVNGDKSVELIAQSTWQSNSWWDNQVWEMPKFRLNCPPILLPDNTYLSVFHTMRYMSLDTPWHRIKPNNLRSYWTGFFLFDSQHPFQVLKISSKPFMDPNYILPEDWPFHPPPSGGNPFYPFTIILEKDTIILTGGSNEIALARCSIPLNDVITSMENVEQI